MKIKVCINNFGNTQLNYLDTVLKEYRSYKKYKVDTTIHTTVPLLHEKQVVHPESLGQGLAYPCRWEMADALDAFDIFIYTENDILVCDSPSCRNRLKGVGFCGEVGGRIKPDNARRQLE